MFRMPGCRQPGIRAGLEDPVRVESDPHTARAEASGRSAHAPVCSRAPASAARNRMLQGVADSCKVVRCMRIPGRTPKTKRPRVWRPEGVRVASGDRGDRSPRGDQSIIGKRLPGRAFHRAQTNPRRDSRARCLACLWERGGMTWKVSSSNYRHSGEGREQYADYFQSASDFVEYPNNSYNQPFCRANR
jgi:hypothetical protein